jgi:hypothetical protein
MPPVPLAACGCSTSSTPSWIYSSRPIKRLKKEATISPSVTEQGRWMAVVVGQFQHLFAEEFLYDGSNGYPNCPFHLQLRRLENEGIPTHWATPHLLNCDSYPHFSTLPFSFRSPITPPPHDRLVADALRRGRAEKGSERY